MSIESHKTECTNVRTHTLHASFATTKPNRGTKIAAQARKAATGHSDEHSRSCQQGGTAGLNR